MSIRKKKVSELPNATSLDGLEVFGVDVITNKSVKASMGLLKGNVGEDGVAFIPSVDTAGNLSWSNNGGLENPLTQNIRGGSIICESTYAQLQDLISSKSLLVGGKYVMTDFQNIYYSFDGSLQTAGGRILGDDTHLGVDGLPHPSPTYRLMLTALSATEFDPCVTILEDPNIPNITQWRVEYNITHIPQYGSNHKGAIVRMVSPNKVDICYDWVNALWWRTRDEIIEFQPSAANWDASVMGKYFHTFNCFNETDTVPINLAYTEQALSDIILKSNIHNMGVEGGALPRDYPTTPTTPIDTDQVYNCGNNVFITTMPYATATEFCYDITFDMGCMCNTFVAQIMSGITFAHLNRYFKLYAPKGYLFNLTFGHHNGLGGTWLSTNGWIVANELGIWSNKINMTASGYIRNNVIRVSHASELNLSAPLGSIDYNSIEKAFGSSGVHVKSNSGSIKYNSIGTISNSTLEATKDFGYNLFDLVNNSTISATKTGSIGSLSYNKFYRIEGSVIESGALQNSVINLFLNSNWLTTGGCKYNNIHVFTKSTLRGTSVTSFIADEVNECALGSDNIPIEPINISGKLYKETYSDLALYVTDQSAIAANSARLTAVETTKADLGTDGYVYPAQISPLQGKQTGYYCPNKSNACYQANIAIPQSSFTTEVLFDNREFHQGITQLNKIGVFCVETDRSLNRLYVYVPSSTLNRLIYNNILPSGTHHVVVSLDDTSKRVTILIDGILRAIYFPELNCAGLGNDINLNSIVSPNKSPYHQGRIFNKALSQEEMIALWNGGHPEEYRMIDKSSLFAEYIPEYLSLSGWRDTSGNGNDLTATGSVALSYGKKYSGSALTPLFVARGAVYNDKTGYYELNGLTDITEEQMIRIYEQQDRMSHVDCSFVFSGTRGCRTHFTKNPFAGGYSNSATSFYAAFAKNKDIEIINMSNNSTIKDLHWFAESCIKLKRIIGLAPSPGSYTSEVYNNTLVRCSSLEYLEFKYVKFSLNIVDSPLLTRESILYMITNSANTQPIILTLHQTASARLTPEDIALASSKNITIAVA